MTGDVAMGEAQFIEKAKQLMPNVDEYERMLVKFAEYINLLAEHLPAWKEASLIKPGPDLIKVKSLRIRPTLAFTATGLNIIGRIGYDLFNSGEDWKPFALEFANLSFNKSDPIWKDVMTSKKGKDGKEVWQVATQRGPVMRAVARVRQKIGLDPEPEREFPTAVLATAELS